MGRSRIGKLIGKLMPKNAGDDEIRKEQEAIEDFLAQHYGVM